MLTILRRVIGARPFVPALAALAALAVLLACKTLIAQRDAARALAESRRQTVRTLEQRIQSDARLLAQRDALIAKQNAGIDALAAAARQRREVYVRQYAAADRAAARHDDRAAQIMALPDAGLDELAQCRAARVLLEEELADAPSGSR